jgi:hypothetical protein
MGQAFGAGLFLETGFLRPRQMTRSRTKTVIALVALAAAAAGVIWWAAPGWINPEPRFHGRSLTQWLEPTYHFQNGRVISTPPPDFQTALQSMGTNAVPHLVRMLAAKDYSFCQPLLQRVGDVNNAALNRLGLNKPWLTRNRAVHGFAALGQSATNAIPEMLHSWPTGEMVDALQGIGPAGLPLVLKAITDGDEPTRFAGLFGLQARAYDRKIVVDTWIEHTKDPSPQVRWAATTLLWAAPQLYREVVLTNLSRLESDADPKVAAMAKLTSQRVAASTTEYENTLVPPP